MTLSVEGAASAQPRERHATTITVAELRAQLEARADLVLVDVSEGDAYTGGHISVAVPVPASEVELRLPGLAPRLNVPVVVTADDEGLSEWAAGLARAIGYTQVWTLDGGNAAWVSAGYHLITNFSSLSKALGEYVERRYDTPRLTAEALKAKIDAGEDIVIFDTRPFDEYQAISIPGGIDAPGPELLYRAFDQVRRPTTQVVVNCAGRTRAIIGAQTLINAGFPNPVVSLENGTTAWLLAGYEPARGDDAVAAAPSQDNRIRAVAAARAIGERFGVREISRAELDEALVGAAERSLYLFDVRTDEEFRTGHLDGFRPVPGGQLVQKTDFHIGSRNGRVILFDDADGVRARTTASWLIQLGLPDVSVYLPGPDDHLITGAAGAVQTTAEAAAPVVDADRLAALLDGPQPRPLVIDLEPASPYVHVRHHIPGSVVARRSSLPRTLAAVAPDTAIVFTSRDGRLARLAAAEHAPRRVVRALAGGTDAWRAGGYPVDTGSGQAALDPAERIPEPLTLEQRRVNLDWYIAWGDTIVAELERDGLVSFVDPVGWPPGPPPPPPPPHRNTHENTNTLEL
ncbi:rhodanese-like domain-containing protein, partial [Mycobacterium sp. NPDC003449]